MAASTSARVISADTISGDARSTCCIMPWDAAGTAHARPNIPIAAIQIDARIIVSLYLGGWRPWAAVAAMTNGPNALSPSGYARDHLHDHVLAASRAFHRCLAGSGPWSSRLKRQEPRPMISGARRRKARCAVFDCAFLYGGFASAPRSCALHGASRGWKIV